MLKFKLRTSQNIPVCSTNQSLCINLPTSHVYCTVVDTWVSLPLRAVLELNLSYTDASPLWIAAKADVYLLQCKRQWCTRRNWQLRIGPSSNLSNEGISSQKMNFSWPFETVNHTTEGDNVALLACVAICINTAEFS